jgi:hypothetical protein
MWFTQETKVPSPPPVKTVPNPRETTSSAMRCASSRWREKKRLSAGTSPERESRTRGLTCFALAFRRIAVCSWLRRAV